MRRVWIRKEETYLPMNLVADRNLTAMIHRLEVEDLLKKTVLQTVEAVVKINLMRGRGIYLLGEIEVRLQKMPTSTSLRVQTKRTYALSLDGNQEYMFLAISPKSI